MPTSKKPFLRYQTIDNCLRNTGRKYFIHDLLDTVNNVLYESNYEAISKRQLYKDLNTMEVDFKAPIVRNYENGRIYFRYEDPIYGFQNRPLTADEIEQINETIFILNQFKNVPGLDWISDLSNGLEISRNVHESNQIIHFDTNPLLRGIHRLSDLFKFIRDKKVVDVHYKSFSSEQIKVHRMHPYFLKEYNDRWYLIGFYPKRNDLITLAIDRIENIETSTEKYIENNKWDFENYFSYVIGITRSKDAIPVGIKLKFSKEKTPFLYHKPLHKSQKFVSSDNQGTTFFYKLIINEDLIMLINSFIPDVFVIEPLKLRREILTRMNLASKNYK